MSKILYIDTDGTKGSLPEGTLGYDAYAAGGDEGRVAVGTASGTDILLAKKSEVNALGNIVAPIVVSPANGTTDFIGAVTATYVTSDSYVGVQDYVKWEAATDVAFTNIVDSYEGASNLLTFTPSLPLPLTAYYIRVQQGSQNYISAYSDILTVVTPNIYIETPTLTVEGTPSDVLLNPLLTGSSFNVINGTDTHLNTDWQVVRNSDSVVVYESLADSANLETITLPSNTLDINTAYTFRLRYRGTTYGVSEYVEVIGTTVNTFINTPALTVAGSPSDVPETPTLTTSAFSVTNGTDTHLSTDWEIYDGATLVWSSIGNTSNKLTIDVPDSILSVSTTYTFKARHTGTTYGDSGVGEVNGTTKATFAPTDSYGNTYGTLISPTTGKVWLDRNLSTVQIGVATAYNDSAAYGSYFQWGRDADGHEDITSGTTTTLTSATDTPGHGDFILAPNSPYDWSTGDSDGSIRQANWNPCPTGFRVPTVSEWEAEEAGFENYNEAFTALKLVAAGRRKYTDGVLEIDGLYGLYWSINPDVEAEWSADLIFYSSAAMVSVAHRSRGLSVRCIAD